VDLLLGEVEALEAAVELDHPVLGLLIVLLVEVIA
jgi:hypothetical protein